MSLNIALYKGDEQILSMNWCRNPFGLCDWAEDNFGTNHQLWHVCNEWSYSNAPYIDRALFRKVVDDYSRRLEEMSSLYFYFNGAQYVQFIKNYLDFFPTCRFGIKDSMQFRDGVVAIPMHYFDGEMPEMLQIRRHPDVTVCQQYCAWFGELMHFADLLQNPKYSFYCSN
ncbi:MAG: hypothetical protein KME29_05110 [Calothrix sp. FI2-JRJ7]|jgi:hypothetical protein|nr:hypothetical protein [Calothrix sp. FI2-JRJ7]